MAKILQQPASLTQLFGPYVDGVFMMDTPLALIKAGKFNKVPLLMGTNADEAYGLFYPPVVPTKFTTPKEAKCAFKSAFGSRARELMDIYTIVESDGFDNRKAVLGFISDALFHCDNR